MSTVWLALAILAEVTGTMSLRMVAHGQRAWSLLVAGGYAVAFAMLSLALRAGMTIGVAYGIWTAVGVALVAVASRVLFKEPLTRLMGLGLVLIAAGVLLVELGAAR